MIIGHHINCGCLSCNPRPARTVCTPGRLRQAIKEFKEARDRLPKDYALPGYDDVLKALREDLAKQLEEQAARVRGGSDE